LLVAAGATIQVEARPQAILHIVDLQKDITALRERLHFVGGETAKRRARARRPVARPRIGLRR
jgi:hypothetical protein